LTRQLGGAILAILLLGFALWGYRLATLEHFAEQTQVLEGVCFSIVVLLGLYWGREQSVSKAWLWTDMASKPRPWMILQESLVFLALMISLLFALCCGMWVSRGLDGDDLLVLREKSLGSQKEHGYWVEDVDEFQQIGVTVSFWEGPGMSDLTYKRFPLYDKQNAVKETFSFKAHREVILPMGQALRLPVRTFHGGRWVDVKVTELNIYTRDGSEMASVALWCLRVSVRLALLILLLVWMGKHVSLEVGLVALLSGWLTKVSMVLFSEGKVGKILNQLSRSRDQPKYTERWWENLLVEWSQVWNQAMDQWTRFMGRGDEEALSRGIALNVGEMEVWMLGLLVVFYGLMSLLDGWGTRLR
jgi:hypothetical protein